MLTIQLDEVALKSVTRRIDTMVEAIEQLRHVDLGNELADWETSDMRRKRPYTKHRYNGASTIIRAHSWFEVKGRRKVVRKLIRKGRYIGGRRWSTRPVLRPFLLDQLSDRIEALAEQSLRW
jgi:hypothetical protein